MYEESSTMANMAASAAQLVFSDLLRPHGDTADNVACSRHCDRTQTASAGPRQIDARPHNTQGLASYVARNSNGDRSSRG